MRKHGLLRFTTGLRFIVRTLSTERKFPSNGVNIRGRITLTTAVLLVAAAVIVYGAFKIGPVYINYYMIQNVFEEEAPTIAAQSASDVYNEISKKLRDMNHPCDPRLVRVDTDNSSITISAQYTETVQFIGGYTMSFTFSPKIVQAVKRPS